MLEICVFGSLPVERRRSKDDHSSYVSQASHGLCTILMICAPPRLTGDIKARTLVIVSLRVCSGPQQTRLSSSELATKRKS